MNDLIKIEKNKEGVETINARDLYEFLEVKSDFKNWIKNYIKDFDFKENQDFISFGKNLPKPKGGRPSKEYHISINMAKELSMLQRTEKGKQAREYFIACENKLKEIIQPKTALEFAELFVAAEKGRLKLETQIKHDKPKIDYYEDVSNSTNYFSLNETAKILGWGRNLFMRRLRFDNVFRNNNTPYQQYINQRLFVVKERIFDNGFSVKTTYVTYVTGKGRQWLYKFYGNNDKIW